MQRTLKILLAFSIVAASSLLSSFGFSLLGPSLGQDASWQITAWGYNLGGYDIGAPKAVNQGYRRNAPVVYYAFDQNFVGFFNTNGMDAVRSAFNIMDALTNADNLQLSQFPLYSEQSFDASALDLTDLKSATLGELVEQMGLAQSVRYTWDVHDRFLPAGASCSTNPAANGEEYLITERNIDPISGTYSAYVDGTLYGYDLLESCGTLGVPPDVFTGIAVDSLPLPVPVDVTAQNYEPVAEAPDIWSTFAADGALQNGHYYTGLTYDDAGGLRYLYGTNNIDYENPAPGSQLEVTNSQSQLLETMDLRALFLFAQTNPPAAVQAAFPNIVINSFSTYYTINTNPIVFSYFTNFIGSPAGSPAVLVVGTNGFTYTPQTNYVYNFGNLVYVDYSSNTVVTVATTSLAQHYGEPVGLGIYTNVATQTIILTNQPSGDYFILPAGSCGFNIVQTNVTFVTVVSNLIAVATNTATTNQNGFVGSEYLTYSLTNNFLTYFACDLQTSGPALYEGIGKVTFIEADFDSLIGQTWSTVTNDYTMTMITNGQAVVQHFQRIVTTPDILLDAADEDSPNATQIGPAFPPILRSISYQEDPEVPGSILSSGPGTITDYPTTFTYNDDGPVFFVSGNNVNGYFNPNNAFLGVGSFPPLFAWGSFDASTNPATLYPVGTSTTNFANEILLQITPSALPDATNGVSYSQTFTVSGGAEFQSPYQWSIGTNSWLGTNPNQATTAVPAGLNLSSTGTISGTPTNNPVGPYDFVVKMTDYNGRSVTWNYTINIDQ